MIQRLIAVAVLVGAVLVAGCGKSENTEKAGPPTAPTRAPSKGGATQLPPTPKSME